MKGNGKHDKDIGPGYDRERSPSKARNYYRLIHESIMDHHIVGFQNPQYFCFWMWMIFAAWSNPDEPQRKLVKGKTVINHHGQLTYSLRYLARAWGVGLRTVRTFLDLLENDKMVTRKVTQQLTQITICNFGTYQNIRHSDRHNTDTNDSISTTLSSFTTSKTTKNKSESLIKILSEKSEKDPDFRTTHREQLFEDFWKTIPSTMKTGKKAAQKHFLVSVKTESDMKDIRTALTNYTATRRFKEGYVQNGSTWFHNWRDWLEYSEPKGVSEGKRLVEVTKAGYAIYDDGSYELIEQN